MVAQEIIQIEHLSFKVGQRYLLKDIDWSVKRGEHWAVFGANGSGKTTLLSIIAGFDQYTQGQLRVFGEPFTRENILALRSRIGWVSSSFYDKCLHQENVLDIVLGGLNGTLGVRGKIEDQQIIRAKQLLKELRVGDKVNAGFDMLSKGERQSVLLARALIAEPEILILDEPASGLDVLAREYLLSTVHDLAELSDMTIIYVTHYTEEILTIFEHVLLLQNGRVFGQGLAKDCLTAPVLSKLMGHPVELIMQEGRRYVTMSVASHVPELMGLIRKGAE